MYYDKKNRAIRFYEATPYALPDFTSYMGSTVEQIVEAFGPLYEDQLPLYLLDNMWVQSVFFNMDKNTQKVTAYLLILDDRVPSASIKSLLEQQGYTNYKSQDGSFAFCDGPDLKQSNWMVVFDSNKHTISVIDYLNYGKSTSQTKAKLAGRDRQIADCYNRFGK